MAADSVTVASAFTRRVHHEPPTDPYRFSPGVRMARRSTIFEIRGPAILELSSYSDDYGGIVFPFLRLDAGENRGRVLRTMVHRMPPYYPEAGGIGAEPVSSKGGMQP